MSDSERWPSDYFASRDRFVESARACGARPRSHAIDAVGPGGEALSVDVATCSSGRLEHLIVLVSGVHGAEGFLGAAVQCRALRMLARRGLPAGTGVAMIHAANPWGFAHLRRVDENNVDVNRNFIGMSLPDPAAPAGYAELDPLINPSRAPGVVGEIGYWLNAGRLIARDRGIARLAKAIAEGQYRFPRGLFFGGVEVGASCRLLQDIVLELATTAERVSVLDVHSGLGRPADVMLIGDGNIGVSEGRSRRLSEHYRRQAILDSAADNVYDARGTFARWCRGTLDDKRFLYLCVEIGTVGPIGLLSALRRENQAHHWSDAGSVPYVRTKQALLEAFAPPSSQWRTNSVAQGLHVLERTIDLPASLGGRAARCGAGC